MTISDADFSAWLKRDCARVVLVEQKFAYESGGVMTEGTVYLSKGLYTTGPSDSPPQIAYRDVVRSVADISSAVSLDTLSGETRFQIGDIGLDAGDGSLDFLLDLIVDGRECAIFIGDPSWRRADFRRIATTAARGVEGDERRLSIRVLDKRLLLDASIQGEKITSGPEAGKLTPIVYGAALNTSPRSLDASANTYKVLENYTAESLVADVRDAGETLGSLSGVFAFNADNVALTANAGTDKLTLAGHGLSNNEVVRFSDSASIFAGLSLDTKYWVISVVGNDFQLSLTRGGSAIDITGTSFTGTTQCRKWLYMDTTAVDGCIQLSGPPQGQVTVDVQRDTPVEREPFDLARRMILAHSEATADDLDSTAFTSADADLFARLDSKYPTVGFATAERVGLVQTLNELLGPLGGWYGQDYDGVIRAGVMDLANLQAEVATRTLTGSDLLEELKIENLPIRFGGSSISTQRNWTVQPDGLVGTLSELVFALYRREFQSQVNDGNGFQAPSAAYLPYWWASHRTAIPLAMTSLISRQLDAGAPFSTASTEIAREAVEDCKPHRKALTVKVGLGAYDWKLGEVVRLTHPRFGFSDGINTRIARRAVDPVAEVITLTLVTQVSPDYTTASQP